MILPVAFSLHTSSLHPSSLHTSSLHTFSLHTSGIPIGHLGQNLGVVLPAQ